MRWTAEVFGAGADVEPLAVIKNHAADLAALPNPIRQDWNKRNALARRDPLKNLPVPDRNVREVVLSGMAVFAFNVHDASIPKRDAGGEPGFPQRQRDVVSLCGNARRSTAAKRNPSADLRCRR